MEPNCAICNGPAYRQCPCEHQSLILAVEQSEQRVLHPMWDEIRYWVTTQAKAEIHRDFQARSSFRRAQHSSYLSQNTGRFTNEMLDRMNNDLQRGIDEDWRIAVQRYPEVLDYFYSMVAWTVRADCTQSNRGLTLSPRVEKRNGEDYCPRIVDSRNIHIPAPIGGGPPQRPFYARNNSYGGSIYSETSGYASASTTGSSSTNCSPHPHSFPAYAYGCPPIFRP